MLIGETIRVALGALRANKLRSLLTMLGIVIGVAAVIAVVALGNGAQKQINDRITALGTTLLTINPGQGMQGGVRTGGGGAIRHGERHGHGEEEGQKPKPGGLTCFSSRLSNSSLRLVSRSCSSDTRSTSEVPKK